MLRRLILALAVSALLGTSASAQVVRFQTTMGDFDMVLNPTNNPRLQGHVDNLLAYVEDERYRGVWINRAAENFVLQMGGFYSHTKRPPPLFASTGNVQTFAPVRGEPGIPGLSNTVGTVSMALQPNNPNSGTSSFFVNLANNSGLDNQFTVFAAIPNMTVINAIMALPQQDLTTHFGLDPGNLAFIDVPIMDDGKQVFIKRAFVVTDAMTIAMANSAVAPLMAASLAAAGSGGLNGASTPAAASSATAVPEPSGVALLLVAAVGTAMLLRRR